MQVPRAPRGRAQTQGLTTASSLQVRASPSCAQTAGAGEGDAGVSPSEPRSHVQRAWVWDSGEWGCCEICLPPRVQMGFLGEPMPRQACGWRTTCLVPLTVSALLSVGVAVVRRACGAGRWPQAGIYCSLV